MALAFNLLLVLIVVGPVVAYVDDQIMTLLQIAVVGAAAVALALRARQIDSNHIATAMRGVMLIAVMALAVPMVQLLPLPLSWAHPIWRSFAEAVPGTTIGYTTVDIGRTFQTLVLALALLTVTTIAVAVSRDRRRAESILLASCAMTALMSAIVVLQSFAPAGIAASLPRAAATSFSSLGIILSAATILLAFERRETRRDEARHYLPIGLGSVAAILIHVATLSRMADKPEWIAAGFGLAILFLLVAIRRLALSRWAAGALCLAALVGTAIVVRWLFERNADATGLLRFILPTSSESQAALQRMLADSRWIGSGAGAFDIVARIYQSGAMPAVLKAPTAIIAMAVDIGWLGLIVIVFLSAILFAKLFWGALSRGRDWFFSAAAAASIAMSLCGSLLEDGLQQSALLMMLAILVGTGLSQAFSQSARH